MLFIYCKWRLSAHLQYLTIVQTHTHQCNTHTGLLQAGAPGIWCHAQQSEHCVSYALNCNRHQTEGASCCVFISQLESPTGGATEHGRKPTTRELDWYLLITQSDWDAFDFSYCALELFVSKVSNGTKTMTGRAKSQRRRLLNLYCIEVSQPVLG